MTGNAEYHELATTLRHFGYYDYQNDVKIVPATITGLETKPTEAHERVHRELAIGSSFGYLQIALCDFFRQDITAEARSLLQRLLKSSLELSRFVHEGTATYLSLLATSVSNQTLFQEKVARTSPEYRGFAKRLERVLFPLTSPLPVDFRDVLDVLLQAAVLALNVPVLTLIRPQDLAHRTLSDLLGPETPDGRFSLLLEQVDWSQHLRRAAELRQERPDPPNKGSFRDYVRAVAIHALQIHEQLYNSLSRSTDSFLSEPLSDDFVARFAQWQGEFANECQLRFGCNPKPVEFEFHPSDRIGDDDWDLHYCLTTGGGKNPVVYPTVSTQDGMMHTRLAESQGIQLLKYVFGPYVRPDTADRLFQVVVVPFDRSFTFYFGSGPPSCGYFITEKDLRSQIAHGESGIWMFAQSAFYGMFAGEYETYDYGQKVFVSYSRSSTRLIIDYLERQIGTQTVIVSLSMLAKAKDVCLVFSTVETQKVIYVFPLSHSQSAQIQLWLARQKDLVTNTIGIIRQPHRESFERYISSHELNAVSSFTFHCVPWLWELWSNTECTASQQHDTLGETE